MSRNYLGVSKAWKQQQLELARAILAGQVRFSSAEEKAFYEASARRTLKFHGEPVEAVEEKKKEAGNGRLF